MSPSTTPVDPSFALAAPLSWEQLRCLLWEILPTAQTPRDWPRIAERLNERSGANVSADGVAAAAERVLAAAPELADVDQRPEVGAQVWNQLLYRTIHRLLPASPIFMNLGYAGSEGDSAPLELASEQEPMRLFLQLYWTVLAGQSPNAKDVLEVGCGCGGWCCFLSETFEPRSTTGLDSVEENIAAARRHAPRVSFRVGEAERLPFAADEFDLIFNVESSHAYAKPERFFAEAARVLRPGGMLLFADHRPRSAEWGAGKSLGDLKRQLRSSGLDLIEEAEITAGVAAASRLFSPMKSQLLEALELPRQEAGHLREMLHLEGSDNFRKIESGEWVYLRALLRKSAPGPERVPDYAA